MGDSFIDDYQPYAEDFEGRIPWMYLDTRGFLTIGIGHLLYRSDQPSNLEAAIKELWKFGEGPRNVRPSADSAQALAQACGGRKAGPQWDSVNQLERGVDPAAGATQAAPARVLGVLGVESPVPGKPGWKAMLAEARKILDLPHGPKVAAGYFQSHNSFQMLDSGLDELFAHDVEKAVGELHGMEWVHIIPGRNSAKDYKKAAYPEFADFDNFPPSAQMAIVDLAFQMGAAGLAYAGGGAFRKAIGKADWKEAARLCPQPKQASDKRNYWRRQRMEMAVSESYKSGKTDRPNDVMLAP